MHIITVYLRQENKKLFFFFNFSVFRGMGFFFFYVGIVVCKLIALESKSLEYLKASHTFYEFHHVQTL